MPRPFLLAQLSDPHIGGEWGGPDPVAGLAAAVEAVRRLPQPPHAVLLTGDVADNAADAEYRRAVELLSPLAVPLYPVPGNHDDREGLRRRFGLGGAPGEPVHYAADLGPLRLIALDTLVPGQDGGALGGGQLAWLEAELAASPGAPTLLAMHHPPFVTGVPVFDEIGLAEADRLALAAVVERHPQVRRIVAGHVHQPIAGSVAGRPALTVPSTYVQFGLDLESRDLRKLPGPAGFAVHTVNDGEVVSHVLPVH
jgi:3',5'-cyclic-AMP phosphodiesterase